MSEIDDDTLMKDLAEDFGVEEKPVGRSALEQRIQAGFEEIERFVEQHGRVPQHGEDRDIFERLYAVRLDRLRQSNECRAILKDVDSRGLLGTAPDLTQATADEPNDAELQAALGELVAEDDVTNLVHVRSHEERKAAEDVARRSVCADFDNFRPMFDQVQQELTTGLRKTAKYERNGKLAENLKIGDLFIIGGQKAMIVSEGESVDKPLFPGDRRLRVIFDNGTEANLWLRSLKRALYEDGNRVILPLSHDSAPLFAGIEEEGDLATGYIYVLRSMSDHPFVVKNRDILHKIGVTGGDVKSRIANAKKEPTYLLADVEIVASYKLANINQKKLEGLLHKFLAAARLDMELKDRFGFQVEPREWFLVPLYIVDDLLSKIRDGSVEQHYYDPNTASIMPITAK